MPYAFTQVTILPPTPAPAPPLVDTNIRLENGAAPLAGRPRLPLPRRQPGDRPGPRPAPRR